MLQSPFKIVYLVTHYRRDHTACTWIVAGDRPQPIDGIYSFRGIPVPYASWELDANAAEELVQIPCSDKVGITIDILLGGQFL